MLSRTAALILFIICFSVPAAAYRLENCASPAECRKLGIAAQNEEAKLFYLGRLIALCGDGSCDGDMLPAAHNDRGLVYQLRGDHENAAADFTSAIDASPDTDVLYANRALSLWAMGRPGNAIEDYGRAIELSGDAAAHAAIAAIHISSGDAAAARESVSNALDIIEGDGDYSFETAVLAIFADSIETTGGLPAPETIGDAASEKFDQQDYEGAAVYYFALLLLTPGDAVVAYNLASSFKACGYRTDATFYYYRYLSLAPGADDAKDVMATISRLGKIRISDLDSPPAAATDNTLWKKLAIKF